MKKHVQEYYIVMQKQYNEMLKVLDKVNAEIKEGKVSNEQREAFENYFGAVKCNYDRVAYIYHLLCLPPNFIQKMKEKKIQKQQEEFLKKLENATLEDVKNENDACLEKINEELEKIESSEGE